MDSQIFGGRKLGEALGEKGLALAIIRSDRPIIACIG
jgi:hypothetical protein